MKDGLNKAYRNYVAKLTASLPSLPWLETGFFKPDAAQFLKLSVTSHKRSLSEVLFNNKLVDCFN